LEEEMFEAGDDNPPATRQAIHREVIRPVTPKGVVINMDEMDRIDFERY